MRKALLGAVPEGMPGITVADAKRKLLPKLPQDLFPSGERPSGGSRPRSGPGGQRPAATGEDQPGAPVPAQAFWPRVLCVDEALSVSGPHNKKAPRMRGFFLRQQCDGMNHRTRRSGARRRAPQLDRRIRRIDLAGHHGADAAVGSAVLPRDRRVRSGTYTVHRPYSAFGVGLEPARELIGTRTAIGSGLASRSGAMLKVHCFAAPTAASARTLLNLRNVFSWASTVMSTRSTCVSATAPSGLSRSTTYTIPLIPERAANSGYSGGVSFPLASTWAGAFGSQNAVSWIATRNWSSTPVTGRASNCTLILTAAGDCNGLPSAFTTSSSQAGMTPASSSLVSGGSASARVQSAPLHGAIGRDHEFAGDQHAGLDLFAHRVVPTCQGGEGAQRQQREQQNPSCHGQFPLFYPSGVSRRPSPSACTPSSCASGDDATSATMVPLKLTAWCGSPRLAARRWTAPVGRDGTPL